jgi:ABC-type antimicrobial peptide transport system permease subunit
VSPDTIFSQMSRTMALVVRTSVDPASITTAVQRAVRELDPSLPTFDVKPMTAVVSSSMAQLSFIILILGAAAAVTLVLGAIGLYGVMAYVVTLRTKELGVRIALGAQPSAVAAMMTKQGLALTAFGIGGGLLLFALVARFLRSFLFGVAPSDPLTLAAASLTLVAIATLASWIPARRAARVDPADALRAE